MDNQKTYKVPQFPKWWDEADDTKQTAWYDKKCNTPYTRKQLIDSVVVSEPVAQVAQPAQPVAQVAQPVAQVAQVDNVAIAEINIAEVVNTIEPQFSIQFVGRVKISASTPKSMDDLETLITRGCSGYEVITGACIPYYDFDNSYKTDLERSNAEKTDVEKAINAVKKVFPTGKLYTFVSHGESKDRFKNSIHILVRGCGYATCGSVLPMVEGCDPAVYKTEGKRQLFRLPYFNKEGEKRPLVYLTNKKIPYNKNEYPLWCVSNIADEKLVFTSTPEPMGAVDITDIQFLLDKIDELKPEYIVGKAVSSVKTINDLTCIYFKDLVKTPCLFGCKKTHNDNRTYAFFERDTMKLFLKCNKASKAIHVFNFSPEPVEKELDKKIIFGKYNPTIFDNAFCSRYEPLTKAIGGGNDIYLLANMGKGKTKVMSDYLKVHPKLAYGIITFRTSLAEKGKEDFPDAVCYVDKRDAPSIKADKWICQLDSLHKIESKNPDLLYLDEVSQIRRHMASETFVKQRKYVDTLSAFAIIIQSAKQIVCSDANLTSRDIDWIAKLRGVKPMELFINTSPRNETITIVKNEQRVSRLAKQDIKNGLKIVIAHNGAKRHHEALRRVLGVEKEDALIINSDTMAEPNVQLALNDPNAEFGNYKVVIYSPSVQSGISYNLKNVFHRVYGMFNNCTNGSGDICQMLNRIRHPKEGPVVSIATYTSGDARTIKELNDRLSASREHLKLVMDKDCTENPINCFTENEFLNHKELTFINLVKIEESQDKLNFRNNFIWWQKYYGNNIIFESSSVAEEKKKVKEDGESKKEHKLALQKVLTEEAIELNNAINLSAEKVELLKKDLQDQKKISKDMLLSLKKFNLNKMFKMEEPVDSPDWYKTYAESAIKKAYYNLSKYYTETSADDVVIQLKEYEIDRELNNRILSETSGSIESCIADFIINKPRFQKENLFMKWLKMLGFNSPSSTVKVPADAMLNRMAGLVQGLTEKDFAILEKRSSKLAILKSLKRNDKDLMKTGLSFINGSLKSYYGVAIRKPDRHSTYYEVNNVYIEGGIFKDPRSEAEVKLHTPILGKGVYESRNNDEVDVDNILTPEEMLEMLDMWNNIELEK